MKLEEHPGQLTRAAVELAKAWRNDKYLRRLEATMVVADATHTFQITGGGDVIEPHDGVIGIGSGGPFATAAARALIDVPGMDAKAIALKSMHIAADTCVYTNHNSSRRSPATTTRPRRRTPPTRRRRRNESPRTSLSACTRTSRTSRSVSIRAASPAASEPVSPEVVVAVAKR